ncbi:MAG: hypothetical protein TH68_09685, partial [Candidatus Synechococcus spongiarum 142]
LQRLQEELTHVETQMQQLVQAGPSEADGTPAKAAPLSEAVLQQQLREHQHTSQQVKHRYRHVEAALGASQREVNAIKAQQAQVQTRLQVCASEETSCLRQ